MHHAYLRKETICLRFVSIQVEIDFVVYSVSLIRSSSFFLSAVIQSTKDIRQSGRWSVVTIIGGDPSWPVSVRTYLLREEVRLLVPSPMFCT